MTETEAGHIPSQESESLESKELELDRFLLEHAPVNSGSNALIFKMRSDEIPEAVKRGYVEQGSQADNAAVKLLKVYSPGRGKLEFDAQTTAYNMVEKAKGNGEDLAFVPTPLEWQGISIEEETKQLLNKEGATLVSNSAELLVMDYIEGDDLATVFYKWIIEHCPEDKKYIAQSVNPDSFESLQIAVAQILEFAKPGGKSANEATRIGEEKRIANMNAENLYRSLRRSGFRLNPRVVTQIKNTLRLFKSNNFYHNDDHERNFMVVGDVSGSGEVQTYVIDFDKAGPLAEGQSGDFRIDHLLAQLVERVDDPREALLEGLNKKIGNPEWVSRMEGYFSVQDMNEAIKMLRKNSLTAASSEAGFEDFVAIMMKMVQNGQIQKSEASDILETIRLSLVIVTGGRKASTRIISQNIYNKAKAYKELFT